MTRARDVANLIGSGNYSSTTFTATAGQTAFTISHTQGFIQVFMNGLLLDETVDYTSNGSAVTLTSGAAAGDEIEVVAYNTFSVGDALNQAAADTRYVNTSGDTMTGDLSVTGDLFVTNSTNAKLSVSDNISEVGSGNLALQAQNSASSALKPMGFRAEDFRYAIGSNEVMKIDSSGRVLTPSQPAFRAYPTSTQANVTGASQLHSNGYTWTSLFNIGNHFNNSGTFTAPVAGRYVFIGHWTVYGADSNFGDAAYHMFVKNNNTSGNNGSYATSGMSMWDARGSTWDQLYTAFGGSVIMNLAANDAVTMYGGVLDGGSNNLDLVGSNVWYTTIMSGYLIG